MRRLGWRWLSILALTLTAVSAQAHTRSQSQTSWTIDGRIVRVVASIPEREAERITPDQQPPSNTALLSYLGGHLGVSAGPDHCPLAIAPHVLLATTGYRRIEVTFDCPRAENLTLHFSAFFELIASHFDLGQIQLADGRFIEQVFTSDEQSVNLAASLGDTFRDAGFFRFVAMGIMHIFTGIDHMSFLLGLVLISRRLRDLVFVVSGFTIGHSITLALAVTGVIRPHGQFIDALVALTIVLIGIDNIVVAVRKPSGVALTTGLALLVMAVLSGFGIGVLPAALLLGAALFSASYLSISGELHDSGGLRMVVTMVFGLIHGFGFAADLLDARLPVNKLLQILAGFNIGVEIGQLAIVLGIAGIVVAASRARIAVPRTMAVDALAPLLIAIGTIWFIRRSFV